MNCYELKMAPFLTYLFDEVEKPANWDDIYSEYIGLRENKNSLFILSLMKEVAYLKTKYFLIEKICEVLTSVVTNLSDKITVAQLSNVTELTDLIKTLKEYGYRYPYDMKNKLTFSKDIRAVLSSAKKLITTRQRKEQELEQYQKRHAGKELTKKDFNVWAVTLTKFLGNYVNLEVVTVAMWCEMMNQYERYCEVQNAQQNNVLKYGRR